MKRIHRTLAVMAALSLLLTLLPLAALAETLQVSPSSLNLRTSPSTSSQVVAVYQRGTKVTVLGTSGQWTRVRTPDGKTGYMLTSYLKKVSSAATASPAATPAPDSGKAVSYYAYTYTAGGSNVIMRSSASTAAGAVRTLPVGTRVLVSREYTNGWRRIRVSGQTGYVLSSYLSKNKPAAAATAKPTATPQAGRAVNYYAYAYTASGSRVVLRSSPAATGTALRLLDVGTQVRVTREGLNGWCQVNVGGVVGYISASYLTRTNPTKSVSTPSPAASYMAYVKSSNGSPVNFRTGPGTGYNIIGQAPSGTQITVVSQRDGWCFIRIGSVYGYMSASFISRTAP